MQCFVFLGGFIFFFFFCGALLSPPKAKVYRRSSRTPLSNSKGHAGTLWRWPWIVEGIVLVVLAVVVCGCFLFYLFQFPCSRHPLVWVGCGTQCSEEEATCNDMNSSTSKLYSLNIVWISVSCQTLFLPANIVFVEFENTKTTANCSLVLKTPV